MNVVVVCCNGLNLGFLGAYGNRWIRTPHLDGLAAEGVVFDAHFPENLTTIPTRRSWWTGRYGFADPESGWEPLRPDEELLSDRLGAVGIRTALISDVPYLRAPGYGFGRGFDEVTWIRGAGYDEWIPAGDPRGGTARIKDEPGLVMPPKDDEDYATWKGRWEQFLRNRHALRAEGSGSTSDRAVAAALDWLDRRGAAGPFFLWIDLFGPHGPWDLAEEDRDLYADLDPDDLLLDDEGNVIDEELSDEEIAEEEDARILIDVRPGMVGDVLDDAELRRLRKTYAGAVTAVDRAIGRLLERLRASGRFDDTLIVFTADQGEPLGEHDVVRRPVPWLYEELVHTPLVVRLPGGEQAGTRHRALVQAVDLYATILAGFGLDPDPEAHGFDLLPLLRGEIAKVRDYACLGMDREEFAIRTQLWYLILPVDTDDPSRRPELYRKPEDRWDRRDVIAEHPDVADQLELQLRRFVDALTAGKSPHELPALRDVARFSLK